MKSNYIYLIKEKGAEIGAFLNISEAVQFVGTRHKLENIKILKIYNGINEKVPIQDVTENFLAYL